MIRAEPQSIFNYLAEHFDLLRKLFDIYDNDNNRIITQEQIDFEIKEYGKDVSKQLYEYKILKQQKNGFTINNIYLNIFRFILSKFKPLLPESINKFHESIHSLFLGIKEDKEESKNLLLNRIIELSNNIYEFRDSIEDSTIGLLNKTRILKANIKKIDYKEKVEKAHYWIEHYISPLTKILDVNHQQSIFNLLSEISEFANNRRLDYDDEGIRVKFEGLYYSLSVVIEDIQKQHHILISELAPLLERIKTENEILLGIHYYLTNANYTRHSPPKITQAQQYDTYSTDIKDKTELYFEQFIDKVPVYIQEDDKKVDFWIFDKQLFKEKLDEELPIQDFFSWCEIAVSEANPNFKIDDFFMVCSLLFEQDYQVKNTISKKIFITMGEVELSMPKLEISKKIEYGLSRTA